MHMLQITNDDAAVPGWEGKVVVWIEEDNTSPREEMAIKYLLRGNPLFDHL